MPSQIIATGVEGRTFKAVLEQALKTSKPDALGIAVAYVSVAGVQYLRKLIVSHDVKQLRLVADTKDGITHPAALRAAVTLGWDVRVVDELPGTFHPKLYVGGAAFSKEAGVTDVSLIIQGSANLSAAALYRNGECSYVSTPVSLGKFAGRSWKEFWAVGKQLTPARLESYEKYFAVRNRNRSPADLVTLGVADGPVSSPADGTKKRSPREEERAVSNTVATTAWAGLQSFTGDYNLQVEFPRDAGAVLTRLLGGVGTATLVCEDGVSRDFIFSFYKKNGMYRLNIHNDTPSVSWVREHKDGVAVVDASGPTLQFRIIRPGPKMLETVDRSFALGTWGKTTTRLFGWY